jgi:Xaa-Pro aminopeptidase
MVGDDFLPVLQFRRLREWSPRVEWEPQDYLVEAVRRIKSPLELDCYRHAGEIATAALSAMMTALRAGETEAAAAAAAAYELLKRGGNYQYMPISHGRDLKYFANFPLNGYGETAPLEGDLVRGWVWGPIYQGYWLDPGRTAVMGAPTPGQRQVIDNAVEAIELLSEQLRPGAEAIEIARYGERLLEKYGGPRDQAAKMFPLFGHGVGQLWEQPYFSTQWPTGYDTVEAGMVVGIEFFLSEEGAGSAGFEDNFIVTSTGPERITTTPMTWW